MEKASRLDSTILERNDRAPPENDDCRLGESSQNGQRTRGFETAVQWDIFWFSRLGESILSGSDDSKIL